MLESIRIENFESHENTIVKFGKGFNLVWGKSDSGKSSILRALAVAVNNQFSSKMVREGFAYCEIEVTTDKGKVNCKRGEGVNKWLVTDSQGVEHSFDKIGKSVPDLASEVLGMKEKQWGKKLNELPNFMFQDEKHYMLSEIGGEKSTSNMVARLMDKTIGLGGIEELVKEISSNILKNRKQITELQNKQSVIKSGMLPEDIIETYEDKLKSIKKTRDEILELEDKIKFIEDFLSIKNEFDKKRNHFLEIERSLSEVQTEYEDCKCQLNLIDNINEYVNVKSNLDKSNEKLSLVIEELNVENELSECKEQIVIFEKIDDFINVSDNLRNKKSKLELTKEKLCIEDELKEVNEKIKKYWDFQELVNEILFLSGKLKTNKVKLEDVSNETEKTEHELHEIKDELGVCPICGKTFDK